MPRPAANEAIAEFVTGYYRLMPDTHAGWPLIGPNLQRRGLSDYEVHWGRISAVDVHRASATSVSTPTPSSGRNSDQDEHGLGSGS